MRVMEYAVQHGASVELYPEPSQCNGDYVLTVAFPDGMKVATIISPTDRKPLCKNDDLQGKLVNYIIRERNELLNRVDFWRKNV